MTILKSPFGGLGGSLFDISPNIIIIVDENAIIGSANPFALKELGFEPESLCSQDLSVLFDTTNIKDVKSSIVILDWLVSQYEAGNLVKVKTRTGHTFKSRLTVGELSESVDGKFRRIICIHDSGELNNALIEQDRYKQLLETALGAIPDGFAIYDKDDRLQVFNKAYLNVYKRSEPIIKIGETFENILRYGLKEGQYLDAGNTEQSQEAWLSRRLNLHESPTGPAIQNVGDRWLRVEERKLEDGSTVGIRADITQLVEAKSTAEMLGNILDDMAAPVIFTNLETLKFEYANKAALVQLGYSLEEFVELEPTQIYRSLPGAKRDEFIKRAMANPGKVVSLRSVHLRKDGTTYPCLINSVCETKGNSQRLISFIKDETEEERMRIELDVKQAQLETLVYNLPCFIAHSKPDTTILFVNEEYAAHYGFMQEQMVGMKFSSFAEGQARSRLEARLKAITEKSPIFSLERAGVDEEGNEYTIFWTNRMLYKDGKQYALLSVGRDITDIKNAEMRIERQAHQLELRNQALEQFAGIVSHDLRSPLRHIRMFGEMLMEEYEEQNLDKFPLYIGKMRDGVLRMDRLIGSLLEFSQVAYKQVNRSEFMLSAAVEEAKDTLAATILNENAAVYIDGDDIILDLDYVLFIRLLENLIDNSVKYYDGTGGAEIRINGTRDNDNITIKIADNGIGIPTDQSERVFKVFHRLHVDEKVYKGTGVGLALAKRIVEGHNGTIQVDPDFVGGTQFVISIPVNH